MALGDLDFEKPIRDLEKRIDELRSMHAPKSGVMKEIRKIERRLMKMRKTTYSGLTAWQRTQIARHPKRPYTLDYVERLFTGFHELHGDRRYSDDPAIVGGFCYFDGTPLVIIGHQKGRGTRDNLTRNFGMPQPEGYRKALRLMRLAEKFQRPVLTIIDTPGAAPFIEAEERGQAEAIARNLCEMATLRTPLISLVTGEGSSGGALGLGLTDRILMQENSIYSVISPEGCAAIVWKDASKAPEAAEALSLSADKLAKLGIIDEIIKEPFGGAHNNYSEAAENIKEPLMRHLKELMDMPVDEMVDRRYMKYRKMGVFFEKE